MRGHFVGFGVEFPCSGPEDDRPWFSGPPGRWNEHGPGFDRSMRPRPGPSCIDFSNRPGPFDHHGPPGGKFGHHDEHWQGRDFPAWKRGPYEPFVAPPPPPPPCGPFGRGPWENPPPCGRHGPHHPFGPPPHHRPHGPGPHHHHFGPPSPNWPHHHGEDPWPHHHPFGPPPPHGPHGHDHHHSPDRRPGPHHHPFGPPPPHCKPDKHGKNKPRKDDYWCERSHGRDHSPPHHGPPPPPPHHGPHGPHGRHHCPGPRPGPHHFGPPPPPPPHGHHHRPDRRCKPHHHHFGPPPPPPPPPHHGPHGPHGPSGRDGPPGDRRYWRPEYDFSGCVKPDFGDDQPKRDGPCDRSGDYDAYYCSYGCYYPPAPYPSYDDFYSNNKQRDEDEDSPNEADERKNRPFEKKDRNENRDETVLIQRIVLERAPRCSSV